MIDVNIKGVLYGIAAVLPTMREQKSGHIINLSSLAGHHVYKTSAVYSGTKFGVRAISEGLRMEESPESNIRSTIISPGLTNTELLNTDNSVIRSMAISPDSIAKAIAYAINEPATVAINEIMVSPTILP